MALEVPKYSIWGNEPFQQPFDARERAAIDKAVGDLPCTGCALRQECASPSPRGIRIRSCEKWQKYSGEATVPRPGGLRWRSD